MNNFYYSVTVVFTIVLIVYGIFYLAIAAYGLARGGDSKHLKHSKRLILSRFLSGVSNILIGITLYWHIDESTTSTTLILLTMMAFVLWEWFARAYFIEQTD